MGIKKQELRDYFSNKVGRKTLTLRKEIMEHVEAVMKPEIEKFVMPVQYTDGTLARVVEQLTLLKDNEDYELYIGNTYDFDKVIEKCNSYTPSVTIKTNILFNIKQKVEFPNNHYNIPPRFDNLVAILIHDTKDRWAVIEDLKTLKKEAYTIINNATNGDKAFKELKDLGIDFSDFKSLEVSGLPMVVKLSVDPKLLG